jgi:hypothetical protein
LVKCVYCDKESSSDSELCQDHEFALFQVTEILTSMLQSSEPPEWLLAGLRELAWIFNGHPRTVAFVNTAVEIADRFTIERVEKLTINDIKEVNFTRFTPSRILGLLEAALIIEREGEIVRPGLLTRRLAMVRDLGYPLNSPEQRQRALEYQGILAISLLRSMLKDSTYVPQGALAIMSLLSIHALASKEIGSEIADLTWDRAFETIPVRQENKLRRVMLGFLDGVTKMIHDINDNSRPELKPEMITYLQNMRERFRDRLRTRT